LRVGVYQGSNDAAFAFGMQEPIWIDAPGTYHNGGCGFAFADGHSESHHWRSTTEKIGQTSFVASEDDYQDWLWMWHRTSANVSGTAARATDGQEKRKMAGSA